MNYFSRCSFLIDIMQIDHRFKVSILLEWVRPYLSPIRAPKAERPSSVTPPVQGSCSIVNCCRSLMPMPFGQGHQEAGPHVIWSPRSAHPSMKFVRFFYFIWAQDIGLKLDDQDPSTLRPTHSTSTGSSDSAGGFCMFDCNLLSNLVSGHEYHRSRRTSQQDTRAPASNYIRPYIRESEHYNLAWLPLLTRFV